MVLYNNMGKVPVCNRNSDVLYATFRYTDKKIIG